MATGDGTLITTLSAAEVRAALEAQNAPAAEALAEIADHFGLYPRSEPPAPLDALAALEVARLLALLEERDSR